MKELTTWLIALAILIVSWYHPQFVIALGVLWIGYHMKKEG